MGKQNKAVLLEKSWNPQEAYKKISEDINKWPEWKKRAYNETFAISAHAQKVSVGGK